MIFFGMLEQMSDRLPDGGPTGLAQNYRRDPFPLQPRGEPFHLCRFPAAFGAFERNQRHGRFCGNRQPLSNIPFLPCSSGV
jgi:hypothetical protein